MINDTGIPKKGTHSVGVARQYCGQLGKQDNCQGAVTLSVASDHASLPVAHRLYLPHAWTDDPERRCKAGVPEAVTFQTKPQIARDQIGAALKAGAPPAPVLTDAGYGIDTAFRDGITELGLRYIVGIQSFTSLWAPGMEPLSAKAWSGRGRPPSLVGRDAKHEPVSAKQLATSLPASAFKRLTWRHGGNAALRSRFAAIRVHRHIATITAQALGPRSGLWSNGLLANRDRQNAGCPPCLSRSGCVQWSILPSCDGASSATIRISSKNWGSASMRAAVGAAFITTLPHASQLTDS